MYKYYEKEFNNKIQLTDCKTSLIIGHVEAIPEGGFKAVPYHRHKQTSFFSFLPCAKGYVSACFYNRRKIINTKTIQLNLSLK